MKKFTFVFKPDFADAIVAAHFSKIPMSSLLNDYYGVTNKFKLNDSVRVSKDKFLARLNICESCSHWNKTPTGGRCECSKSENSNDDSKIHLNGSKCLQGKWTE